MCCLFVVGLNCAQPHSQRVPGLLQNHMAGVWNESPLERKFQTWPRALRLEDDKNRGSMGRFITPLPPAKPRKSAQQVGRWDCAELLELGPGGPPSPVMSLGILMSCGKRDVGHRLSSEASRTGCTGCRRRSVPCLVDRRSTSTQAP